MRILVADDDRVFMHLIAEVLRTKGHQVVPVFDAMQVVMLATRAPPPDVVILDINMPGGTGIEALRRLKSSLRTALIPVVVVSGVADPALPEAVRALGAETFLGKPLDPAALYSALGNISSAQ
jgi:CheY-like chemotaxis protein